MPVKAFEETRIAVRRARFPLSAKRGHAGEGNPHSSGSTPFLKMKQP